MASSPPPPFDVVVVAAVNGIAYGGGWELAQSTDFIIGSDTATFGQHEAMLGLAAGGGSPARGSQVPNQGPRRPVHQLLRRRGHRARCLHPQSRRSSTARSMACERDSTPNFW
jgi:hypothetical protein